MPLVFTKEEHILLQATYMTNGKFYGRLNYVGGCGIHLSTWVGRSSQKLVHEFVKTWRYRATHSYPLHWIISSQLHASTAALQGKMQQVSVQSLSGCSREKKNLLPLPEVEPWLLGRLFHNPIAYTYSDIPALTTSFFIFFLFFL